MAAGIPVPLLFFLLWRFLLYFPHPTAPLPSRAGFCADPGQGREPETLRAGERIPPAAGWMRNTWGSLRSARKQPHEAEASNGKKHERREERWHIELKSINVEALIYANVFVCVENGSVLSLSNLRECFMAKYPFVKCVCVCL